MTDFGRDLWCDGDIRADMAEATGVTLVAQAVIGRLETEVGGCFYDSEYGEGLCDLVNSTGTTEEDVIRKIETGALKDERVELCDVTSVEFDNESETITASASLETSAGPFSMTIEISVLEVDMLNLTEE
jgi:hypothetical protein